MYSETMNCYLSMYVYAFKVVHSVLNLQLLGWEPPQLLYTLKMFKLAMQILGLHMNHVLLIVGTSF